MINYDKGPDGRSVGILPPPPTGYHRTPFGLRRTPEALREDKIQSLLRVVILIGITILAGLYVYYA